MPNSQNATRETPKTLLLIEDDDQCAAGYAKAAKEANWSVLLAQSLDDARRLAAGSQINIAVAVIDLMIPRNSEDLEVVRKLFRDRDRLRKARRKRNLATQLDEHDLAQSYVELDRIDARMRDLILVEGGLTFLTEAAENHWLINAGVIILTGRPIDEPVLLSRCEPLKKRFPRFDIVEKPITRSDLKSLLRGSIPRLDI